MTVKLLGRMNIHLPQLLAAYVQRPRKGSLSLVTNVLGASANWLVLRFIASALQNVHRSRLDRHGAGNEYDAANVTLALPDHDRNQGADENDDGLSVVLVSWMHDWEFWRTECRRSVGIDLPRLLESGRFVFLDGLAEPFLQSLKSGDHEAKVTQPASPVVAAVSNSPFRTPLLTPPGQRIGLGAQQRTAGLSSSSSPSSPSSPSSSSTTPRRLQHTFQCISDAINRSLNHNHAQAAGTSRVLLVLDMPTVLLETYAFPTDPGTGISSGSNDSRGPSDEQPRIQRLETLILNLRAKFGEHLSTIVVAPADDPLLAPAQNLVSVQHRLYRGSGSQESESFAPPRQDTPLETAVASFVVGLAHQSRHVIQCRRLDTGWADDVSGVIRVTRGGFYYDSDEENGDDQIPDQDAANSAGSGGDRHGNEDEEGEGEWLYYVGANGSVKVWRRGASK